MGCGRCGLHFARSWRRWMRRRRSWGRCGHGSKQRSSLRSKDSPGGCPHTKFWFDILLGNYAAGDAVAGVAGGIGLHVVGFGVDHDRSAAIAEQRVGAVGESYIFILKGGVGFAAGVHGQVEHVAGVMAFGILEAVFLALRIEMRAGGFEVGAVTFCVLMDMDPVVAGREIVK